MFTSTETEDNDRGASVSIIARGTIASIVGEQASSSIVAGAAGARTVP
jgi:hypothetical protein